jgi:hypothetical protein
VSSAGIRGQSRRAPSSSRASSQSSATSSLPSSRATQTHGTGDPPGRRGLILVNAGVALAAPQLPPGDNRIQRRAGRGAGGRVAAPLPAARGGLGTKAAILAGFVSHPPLSAQSAVASQPAMPVDRKFDSAAVGVEHGGVVVALLGAVGRLDDRMAGGSEAVGEAVDRVGRAEREGDLRPAGRPPVGGGALRRPAARSARARRSRRLAYVMLRGRRRVRVDRGVGWCGCVASRRCRARGRSPPRRGRGLPVGARPPRR